MVRIEFGLKVTSQLQCECFLTGPDSIAKKKKKTTCIVTAFAK